VLGYQKQGLRGVLEQIISRRNFVTKECVEPREGARSQGYSALKIRLSRSPGPRAGGGWLLTSAQAKKSKDGNPRKRLQADSAISIKILVGKFCKNFTEGFHDVNCQVEKGEAIRLFFGLPSGGKIRSSRFFLTAAVT